MSINKQTLCYAEAWRDSHFIKIHVINRKGPIKPPRFNFGQRQLEQGVGMHVWSHPAYNLQSKCKRQNLDMMYTSNLLVAISAILCHSVWLELVLVTAGHTVANSWETAEQLTTTSENIDTCRIMIVTSRSQELHDGTIDTF